MRFKVVGFKSNIVMLAAGKLRNVARGLQEITYLADFN